MKKLASLMGAGALLLSVAAPAFAAMNWAWVNTNTKTIGKSGDVSQSAVLGSNSGSVLVSGNVLAGSLVGSAVNTNIGACATCGPTMNGAFGGIKTKTIGKSGDVSQSAVLGSNSGSVLGSGNVMAGSGVISLTNTNVSFPW